MTTTTTLAELAATSVSAIGVLERHGLDYCCGGKQALDQACRTKGIAPESVMQEIENANRDRTSGRDWAAAPLGELVQHIVITHHEYLRHNLPALTDRLAKVVSVHGARDPEMLPRLAQVFASLRDELERHLHKEEAILFPCIEQYGRAAAQNRPMPSVPFGSIVHPITMMEREHEGAGDALGQIRALTGDFTLPAYACATVRALYAGLQELESDLHVHIHLENNILFPRAIALEQQ